MWAIVENNTVTQVIGMARPFEINGVKYPPQALRTYTEQALNALGIYRVVLAPKPDPRYKVITNTDYVVNGNLVEEQLTVADQPVGVARQAKIQEVELRRQAVLRGGITVNTKPISTDSGDIDKYTLMAGALSTGAVFPAGGMKVFTLDGQRISLNEAQFGSLMFELAKHFYQTDNNADALVTAIEALATTTEVEAFDISTGWPANP